MLSPKAIGPAAEIICDPRLSLKQFLVRLDKFDLLIYVSVTIGKTIEYNIEIVEKNIEGPAYPINGNVNSIPYDAMAFKIKSILIFLRSISTDRMSS